MEFKKKNPKTQIDAEDKDTTSSSLQLRIPIFCANKLANSKPSLLRRSID